MRVTEEPGGVVARTTKKLKIETSPSEKIVKISKILGLCDG